MLSSVTDDRNPVLLDPRPQITSQCTTSVAPAVAYCKAAESGKHSTAPAAPHLPPVGLLHMQLTAARKGFNTPALTEQSQSAPLPSPCNFSLLSPPTAQLTHLPPAGDRPLSPHSPGRYVQTHITHGPPSPVQDLSTDPPPPSLSPPLPLAPPQPSSPIPIPRPARLSRPTPLQPARPRPQAPPRRALTSAAHQLPPAPASSQNPGRASQNPGAPSGQPPSPSTALPPQPPAVGPLGHLAQVMDTDEELYEEDVVFGWRSDEELYEEDGGFGWRSDDDVHRSDSWEEGPVTYVVLQISALLPHTATQAAAPPTLPRPRCSQPRPLGASLHGRGTWRPDTFLAASSPPQAQPHLPFTHQQVQAERPSWPPPGWQLSLSYGDSTTLPAGPSFPSPELLYGLSAGDAMPWPPPAALPSLSPPSPRLDHLPSYLDPPTADALPPYSPTFLLGRASTPHTLPHTPLSARSAASAARANALQGLPLGRGNTRLQLLRESEGESGRSESTERVGASASVQASSAGHPGGTTAAGLAAGTMGMFTMGSRSSGGSGHSAGAEAALCALPDSVSAAVCQHQGDCKQVCQVCHVSVCELALIGLPVLQPCITCKGEDSFCCTKCLNNWLRTRHSKAARSTSHIHSASRGADHGSGPGAASAAEAAAALYGCVLCRRAYSDEILRQVAWGREIIRGRENSMRGDRERGRERGGSRHYLNHFHGSGTVNRSNGTGLGGLGLSASYPWPAGVLLHGHGGRVGGGFGAMWRVQMNQGNPVLGGTGQLLPQVPEEEVASSQRTEGGVRLQPTEEGGSSGTGGSAVARYGDA